MSSIRDQSIKRLVHRSRYRGFLEIDLILAAFADQSLTTLSDKDLNDYTLLLDQPDQDIYAWITKRAPVPPEHDHDVMAMLQNQTVAAAR